MRKRTPHPDGRWWQRLGDWLAAHLLPSDRPGRIELDLRVLERRERMKGAPLVDTPVPLAPRPAPPAPSRLLRVERCEAHADEDDEAVLVLCPQCTVYANE